MRAPVLVSTFASLLTISNLLYADDKADQAAFATCAACHSVDGSAKATGPTLKAIVGRKAASDTGFKRYSKALTESQIVWTEAELDAYLKAPGARVKGTTMMVAMPDAKRRAAVLRYLKRLK